ncbi:34043_t:CDS:2, partial [Racocetra persica]
SEFSGVSQPFSESDSSSTFSFMNEDKISSTCSDDVLLESSLGLLEGVGPVSLLSSVLGDVPSSALGGAFGSAFGTALGAALGITLGGALGGALGGMFGGVFSGNAYSSGAPGSLDSGVFNTGVL